MQNLEAPPIQFHEVACSEEMVPQRWSIPIRTIPGWLVSLFLHLALLMILGAFSQNIGIPSIGKVAIQLSSADENAAEFEIVSESNVAPELATLEVANLAVADFSIPDLTAEIEPSPVDRAGPTVNLTNILKSGLETDGMSTEMNGLKNGAEFFGVASAGKRFVFVVDSSNSMKGGRLDDAKKEVLQAIKRLSIDQSFYVLFFDKDMERMTFAPDSEPVPGLVAATKENIYKVEKWIGTVANERQTNPLESMQFAVAMLPDAIYLLSDGQFTDRGSTLEFLQVGDVFQNSKKIKRPKVVIHTIGFYSRDIETTLKQISDTYHGKYRFLPDPRRRSSK